MTGWSNPPEQLFSHGCVPILGIGFVSFLPSIWSLPDQFLHFS
jgi:hypothetical protein